MSEASKILSVSDRTTRVDDERFEVVQGYVPQSRDALILAREVSHRVFADGLRELQITLTCKDCTIFVRARR